ncbi:hypothetical protein M9H77_08251 [Catharanthus roseus]|uniref:Uncharacterized protein n=1 Tax=Catharanthus roseus TaxID=4058 RepID=A0ACC0BXD3_CATRO|nr:hypothetical protein M9H77_08251 [Catharanthus roseus]
MGLSSRTARRQLTDGHCYCCFFSRLCSIVSIGRLRQVLFNQHLHITYLRYRGWTASRIFFFLATLYLITPCFGVVLCRTSVPRPRLCFEKYGVLCDDVVIADQKVAEKSLCSSTGCIEFAKCFRVRCLTRDLSSVSFKSLLNSHHPFGLMAVHKHSGCRVTTLTRVGGARYKALARFYQPQSYHGMAALNPYLRGFIIDFLRREMIPKELRLILDDLFEGQVTFLEWSIL